MLAWADGRTLGREPVGWQAEKLCECLAEGVADLRGFLTGKTAHPIGKLLELLDLDRLGGLVQKGLGIGALFMPGLAAGSAFLLADTMIGAVGKAYDASAGGQEGRLARTARAVAALSVKGAGADDRR